MNTRIFALPLLAVPFVVSGCSPTNAPAESAPMINAPSAPSAVADRPAPLPKSKPSAPKVAAKPQVSDVKPESDDATVPDPAYRVVDEGASLPPELAGVAEALKKASVPPPPKNFVVPARARVTLQTSRGDIVCELDGKAAPLHAKSFLYLAKRGFFDDSRFHRYEPGFVIQGGSALSRGKDYDKFSKYPAPDPQTGAPTSNVVGVGGPGYEIPRERNPLTHDAMVLSAARTSDPDSAGSQFYITLAPAHFLDEAQAQDGVGYTVFGRVLTGQNAVLQLRAGDKLRKVVVAGK